MRDIILACIGIGIAAAGCVYLARLLYYKRFGVLVKAEVLDANEVLKRRGISAFGNFIRAAKRVAYYKHTMKYDFGGKTYEVQDKADYTQPMKVGSAHFILCDPKDPERFKFEEDVTRHITIAAALVAMAVVFAGRFLYSYLN